MPASRLPVSTGLLLAALLTSAGCGTSTGGAAGPPASSVPPSSAAAPTSSGDQPSASASAGATPSAVDETATYCRGLKANGASASDFGAIPTFYPKDQLLDDVQGKLEAMGDVRPPAEVSAAWAVQKGALEKVEAAAKKLPSGGRLSDPGLVANRKAEKAEDTLTKYWFAHCR